MPIWNAFCGWYVRNLGCRLGRVRLTRAFTLATTMTSDRVTTTTTKTTRSDHFIEPAQTQRKSDSFGVIQIHREFHRNKERFKCWDMWWRTFTSASNSSSYYCSLEVRPQNYNKRQSGVPHVYYDYEELSWSHASRPSWSHDTTVTHVTTVTRSFLPYRITRITHDPCCGFLHTCSVLLSAKDVFLSFSDWPLVMNA